MSVNAPGNASEKATGGAAQYFEFHSTNAHGFSQALRLADCFENHAYPGAVDPPEHEYGQHREREAEIIEGNLGIKRDMQ